MEEKMKRSFFIHVLLNVPLLVAYYTCTWAQFLKSGKHTKLNHKFCNWCSFCKRRALHLSNFIYSDCLLLICASLFSIIVRISNPISSRRLPLFIREEAINTHNILYMWAFIWGAQSVLCISSISPGFYFLFIF